MSTDLPHGTYTDPRPIAFKVFAGDWLARTRPTVAPGTPALYEWAVTLYLVPAFGLTAIQNLTAEQIEHWQAELLKAGNLSPWSVEICRTALGTMLKDARMKRRLYANPMEAVRRFDVPKRELHYLTAAQVKELCEEVGRVYGVLFLIMGFCGLRIGGGRRPQVAGERRASGASWFSDGPAKHWGFSEGLPALLAAIQESLS